MIFNLGNYVVEDWIIIIYNKSLSYLWAVKHTLTSPYTHTRHTLCSVCHPIHHIPSACNCRIRSLFHTITRTPIASSYTHARIFAHPSSHKPTNVHGYDSHPCTCTPFQSPDLRMQRPPPPISLFPLPALMYLLHAALLP